MSNPTPPAPATPPATEPTKVSTKAWLLDTIERAGTTYVQALVALLISVGATGPSAWKAAVIAAFPAALNIIVQAIFGWTPPKLKNIYADIAVRTGRTFVYTCLSFIVANLSTGAHMGGAWQAMLDAAIAASLVIVKGGVASVIPSTITPASLAPALTPQVK